MALRGKMPKDIPKRLKLLLYGPAGVGKTTAAIQLPKPYVIDTERGADHYGAILEQSGGAVFQTTEMAELIREVKSLLSTEHSYRTLVIDPITTVYQDLVDECEKQVGTQWGRHYGEANKTMKRLTNLIAALDMNAVVVAHNKPVYGDNMRQMGTTFDGWRRLDFLFDLVIELERRGRKRVAKVMKTRIAVFPDGDQFEWSYDAIADRYGRQILEKQAGTVSLATQDQLMRFKALLAQIGPEEQRRLNIDKALAGIADMSDMSAKRIQRGIDLLEKHIGQPASK